MRTPLVALILTLWLCAAVAPGGSAQCPLAKVQEAASNDLDEFGWNLAQDGDVLAVAELGPDEVGSVHLFDVSRLAGHGRWIELDEVFPSAPAPSLRFGESLALSGGTLVVGASRDGELGPSAGAAYVFERDDDAWVQTAKLTAGDAGPVARFGRSVDVSGDTLIVGASGDAFTGAVYVFERDDLGTTSRLDDTWVQSARIDPDGLSQGSDLGSTVDLSDAGDLVLAGDSRDLTGGGTAGAGLIFARVDAGTPGDPFDDAWPLVDKLQLGPGSDPFSSMGQTVVLGDDVAAVGAPGAGDFDLAGRVYVFTRDTQGTPSPLDDAWSLSQELEGNTGTFAAFGSSLGLDGDVLAVGEPLWQFPPFKGTNVRVYERGDGGDFALAAVLTAPDPQVHDGVGGAVAVSGSLVYSGASGAEYVDDWSPADGAAYAWDLARPPTWTSDGAFLGIDEPVVAGWGPLEAGSAYGVRSYDLFDSPSIWFLLGAARIDQPFKGGVLVPSPDLVVGPVPSDGFGSVTLDGTWPGGIPAGTELWLQTWAQDGPADPDPLRASQGLRLTAN